MNTFMVLLLFGVIAINMCISLPPTEEDEKLWNEARRKSLFVDAKLAGLQDEQLEPSVTFLMELDNKRIDDWVDNCTILNNDGKFLEIDEKNRDKFKYSDVADQNITTRLNFWGSYANAESRALESVCLIIAVKNACVEFMSPVERKIIEDTAKEAGIHEDDIPHIVDLQMRIYMEIDFSTPNYVLKRNYEKLGRNRYTLKVPSAETELEKLESENLSENDLADSAHFWGHKYLQTTGIEHLKSLKNLCVVLMRMQPFITADFNIFEK